MSVEIVPIGARIVARKPEVEKQTASGLYLPDTAVEQTVLGEVTAVGPEVKQTKVGDKIIYKEYASTEVKIAKETYLLIAEEDVLATVKGDA